MTALIPQPQSIKRLEGHLIFTEASTLGCGKDFLGVAKTLQGELKASTGYEWPVVATGGSITFERRHDLQGEAYRLTVSSEGVVISAGSAAGAFYATRTLLQLLPAAILSSQVVRDVTWEVPNVEISDAPRFGWRGAHFDVARHFFDKAFVLRYLDLLAFHKLNVLHFHLTDDQGWRMEIKRYPRLTEVGSARADTMVKYEPTEYSGVPHSGFYTQEDLREIVSYAAERFITVLPEIEMPGHCTAAIAAYPELGNGTEPIEVATGWGVLETVLNVEDSTLEFMRNVLDEVIDVFPSEYIHIGGDECPKVEWKNSPRAQQRMKAEGLADEDELQSWFVRQMGSHIHSRGRRLIGWSEILEGGLAPGAAVTVWLGTEGAVAALQSGHDVVMAQYTHLYFDYGQDPSVGNATPWLAISTLEDVYGYNPIPEGVSEAEAKHVLGLQYQLWTEYISTEERVEEMLFPRACAAAEISWTDADKLNFDGFRSRLAHFAEKLDVLGVRYSKFGIPDISSVSL